jgi:hypothetical protein
MEIFSITVAESHYVITSGELKSLLEAGFGGGLDFKILVCSPSPPLEYGFNLMRMQFCQYIRGRWTYQTPRELPKVRRASVMA